MDNQEDDDTPKIKSIAGKIIGRIPKQLKIILKEENKNVSNLFDYWSPKFILDEEKKLILNVEKELENGNLPIERDGISFIPILKDRERKEVRVNYININNNPFTRLLLCFFDHIKKFITFSLIINVVMVHDRDRL